MDQAKLGADLSARGVLLDSTIRNSFLRIDRADFVPLQYQRLAYEDYALPIGFGQSISQPYTVAFMLDLLGPQTGERILDVGAGSGWTTALLAEIVGKHGHVYGVELIPELMLFGQANLQKYRFPQAQIVLASGNVIGLPENAPYDHILVSAESPDIPDDLLDQLKTGGTLVTPINDALWKITKQAGGELEVQTFDGFVFVPLVYGES